MSMIVLHLLIHSYLVFALPNHVLQVKVDNISDPHGTLMVAVYKEGQKYLGNESFILKKVKVNETKALVISFELPEGTYAISMFQDLNGDEELDTNFFGIPTEPYGFSGPVGTFGPPSFKKASFQVPSIANLLIEMNH